MKILSTTSVKSIAATAAALLLVSAPALACSNSYCSSYASSYAGYVRSSVLDYERGVCYSVYPQGNPTCYANAETKANSAYTGAYYTAYNNCMGQC